MERLDNCLIHFFKKKGWYDRVLESQAIVIYNREVRSQEMVLEDTEAVDIECGILQIITPHSTLNYEIMHQKNWIRDKINQIIGKQIVKDIVLRTGSIKYENR